MALFGRDYDRDYGYRGGAWNRGYDRAGWNNAGWNAQGYDREYYGTAGNGYDRGYKSRWQTDFGDPFGDRTARTPMRMIRGEYHAGYDRGYMGSDRGYTGYDRGYMGSDRGYLGNERNNFGYGRSNLYDRDYYESNPMSYDPYTREGTWNRGTDRNFRTYGRGRGYDAGWF